MGLFQLLKLLLTSIKWLLSKSHISSLALKGLIVLVQMFEMKCIFWLWNGIIETYFHPWSKTKLPSILNFWKLLISIFWQFTTFEWRVDHIDIVDYLLLQNYHGLGIKSGLPSLKEQRQVCLIWFSIYRGLTFPTISKEWMFSISNIYSAFDFLWLVLVEDISEYNISGWSLLRHMEILICEVRFSIGSLFGRGALLNILLPDVIIFAYFLGFTVFNGHKYKITLGHGKQAGKNLDFSIHLIGMKIWFFQLNWSLWR